MEDFSFIVSRCGENGDLPTEITDTDISNLSKMMLAGYPMPCIEEEDGSVAKPKKLFIKCCSDMVVDLDTLCSFTPQALSLSGVPSSQIGSVLGVAIFFSKIRLIDAELSRDGKKVYLIPCCLTTDTMITKDTTILKTVYLKATAMITKDTTILKTLYLKAALDN